MILSTTANVTKGEKIKQTNRTAHPMQAADFRTKTRRTPKTSGRNTCRHKLANSDRKGGLAV